MLVSHCTCSRTCLLADACIGRYLYLLYFHCSFTCMPGPCFLIVCLPLCFLLCMSCHASAQKNKTQPYSPQCCPYWATRSRDRLTRDGGAPCTSRSVSRPEIRPSFHDQTFRTLPPCRTQSPMTRTRQVPQRLASLIHFFIILTSSHFQGLA
jgi:hypothetical protein